MDWSDEGFVLGSRPHGEGAAVVQLLTAEHGRHAGLLHGATSRSKRGLTEPGTRVQATWRARLAEHLGTYGLEVERSYAAGLMDDPLRLAGLSAVCSMAELALPEREPHRALFEGLSALLDAMAVDDEADVWPGIYVRWELGLLTELGFGLDLNSCAATGRNDMLAYVSPRSGRAVSLSAGEAYRDKLLTLPGFLVGQGRADSQGVRDGLRLTGYFLQQHVFGPLDRPLPAARERLGAQLGEGGSLGRIHDGQ